MRYLQKCEKKVNMLFHRLTNEPSVQWIRGCGDQWWIDGGWKGTVCVGFILFGTERKRFDQGTLSVSVSTGQEAGLNRSIWFELGHESRMIDGAQFGFDLWLEVDEASGIHRLLGSSWPAFVKEGDAWHRLIVFGFVFINQGRIEREWDLSAACSFRLRRMDEDADGGFHWLLTMTSLSGWPSCIRLWIWYRHLTDRAVGG